jgi:hypothetical protein
MAQVSRRLESFSRVGSRTKAVLVVEETERDVNWPVRVRAAAPRAHTLIVAEHPSTTSRGRGAPPLPRWLMSSLPAP